MTLDPRFSPVPVTTEHHLQFGEDGGIRSTRFNDFYFNPGHGKDETTHVFLEGNQLGERWRELLSDSKQGRFIIAETGFGTGLNFLAACELWQALLNIYAPENNKDAFCLHYYSIEKYPLSHDALERCIAHYNPFPDIAEKLLRLYPDPTSGQFFIDFNSMGLPVKLHLFFADVLDGLGQISSYQTITEKNVDAWFLDGFAPSENNRMWDKSVYNRIAALSHPANKHHTASTVATFTVAGAVKRGLKAAGFELEKTPGFGKKREMLRAKYSGQSLDINEIDNKACVFTRRNDTSLPAENIKRVAVIGSGIAGSHIAKVFAEENIQVDIYDTEKTVASKASGNRYAALHPRTARQRGLHGDFLELAFHYAYQTYRDLDFAKNQSGLLQVDANLHESQLIDSYFSEKTSANNARTCHDNHHKNHHDGNNSSNHSNNHSNNHLHSRCSLNNSKLFELDSQIRETGIYYPSAGAIHTQSTIAALCKHENIMVLKNTRVLKIHADTLTDSKPVIELCDNNENANHQKTYDAVIVACGSESKYLLEESFGAFQALPTRNIGGQTTTLSIPIGSSDFSIEQFNSKLLDKVICGQGYLYLEHIQKESLLNIHVGASYRLDQTSFEASKKDLIENLDKACDLLALHPKAYRSFVNLTADILKSLHTIVELEKEIDVETRFGKVKIHNHVAIRCTSPDYLPIAGPLADAESFFSCYEPWSKNANKILDKPCPLRNGVYLCTALGSHGFGTAPILAEQVIADVLGEPSPLSEPLRRAVSPQRFLLRSLIRGK